MSGFQDDFQEEEILGKAYDARLMRRLLRYLRPYWWQVAWAVVFLVAWSLLQIVGPWLTQVAVDQAIPGGDVSLLVKLAAAFLAGGFLGCQSEYGENEYTNIFHIILI